MDEDAQTTETPEATPASKGTPWLMIAGIAAVGIVGLIALFATGDTSSSSATPEGEFAALAEFPLATDAGEEVTLAAHAGEPLVLNYFAAWCPPCVAELPEFEEVSQQRAGEVTFVGISRDNATGEWTGLIDQTGVTFDTYFEGNVRGSFEEVGALAMPTTVFITADGEIAQVFSGPLNQQLLNDLIDEHLTEVAEGTNNNG